MNTKNRAVVLSRSCFASPLGHSVEDALAKLSQGVSGISSLEDLFPASPFLLTGAISRPGPEDDAPGPLHPRLSQRYTRVVGNFCKQLRLMVGTEPVDQLFLICRNPFYSDWLEESSAEFDERTFLSRILQGSGIQVPEPAIWSLQASCSSGLVALNMAIRELTCQPRQRILLLGLETELNHERLLALKKLGALSSEKDPRRACQPFSKMRSGLVPGEVAVALLVESKPLEQLEKDDILLRAGFANSDAYRLTDGLESGEFLRECLARTLGELDPDLLDFVCPHATSTPLNDPIEGRALASYFASRTRPLPVVPLKQYLGHTLNSSGLWETVLCAELMRANFLPPLLNPDEQESYPNLQFEREYRQLPLSKALKLSLGFGGINAALLLEKAG